MTQLADCPAYKFLSKPPIWDDSCHRHPGPESRRIDRLMNSIGENTFCVPDSISRPLARGRQRIKGEWSSRRLFADQENEDNKGVKVEYAFQLATGLKMDRSIHRRGDSGSDFQLSDLTTIDVKGANKPHFLLVKTSTAKKCADRLVLAKIHQDTVIFLGWTTRETMLSCPIKTFRLEPSHYLLTSYLKPMEELYDIIDRVEHRSPCGSPPNSYEQTIRH